MRFTVTDNPPTVAKLDVDVAKVGVRVVYAPVVRFGDGARYSWSFGDGTADTASSATVADRQDLDEGRQPRRRADAHRLRRHGLGLSVHPGGRAQRRDLRAVHRQRRDRLRTAERRIRPPLGREPDTDTVGVVDLGTSRLVAEIPVGDRPVTVALRRGGDVWVVNRDSATISIVDSATLKVRQTVTLPRGSQPWGVVFVDTTADAVVTLEAKRTVMLIRGEGTIVGEAAAGPSPRFISAVGDGKAVMISNFITPPLPGESTASVRTVDADGKPVGGIVDAMNLRGVIYKSAVLGVSSAPDTEVSARGVPTISGLPWWPPTAATSGSPPSRTTCSAARSATARASTSRPPSGPSCRRST